ncbi:MAG: ATP-binding protein [Chlamydiales bacterium]|nr:ATP-binding protein [Chlamydiales bacterium]
MERSQKNAILHDLGKKMVLLAGPRQAGKTTLAREIGTLFSPTVYLNYDRLEDRKIIKAESWHPNTELLILDEIHKMPKWKNYLKGIYDTKPSHLKILVTGSARLEIFKKVGDSLAGRFFLHRLLPLSPAELFTVGMKPDVERLIERGGFPEPYLDESPIDAKRWRMQYIDSLIRTDVLDFENIHNLHSMQLLFELLRKKVSSSISYSSLAEDIGIAPNTVKKYIQILEALFIVFRVTPFSKNIARSITKEPKIYFFDTGLVDGDEGAKFENFSALCLLKHVLMKIDYQAEPYALHYLKTKEGIEVDFALVKDNQIQAMIEAKVSDNTPGKGLVYFREKYKFPAFQVVKHLRTQEVRNGIEIVEAQKFFQSLQ